MSKQDFQNGFAMGATLKGQVGVGGKVDQVFDPNSINAQSGKAIADELKKAPFTPLRITISVNPITRTDFYADYSSIEIKKWDEAHGEVIAYFDDTIRQTGEQLYRFDKYVASEQKAYFFRPVVESNSVSRIALIVDKNKNVEVKEIFFDGATKSYVDEQLSEKVNHSIVVVNDSIITQADARDVLEYSESYSGALIEFISHTLNRTIGFGWIISNTDIFLITIDYTGTITQWNKDGFEKHNIESYSYINEIIDIDTLTVDVAGNPPFMASVNNAINRPFKDQTSTKGKVFVIPYAIDCQVQMYMDMTTMKWYSRLVEGVADNHTFNEWQEIGKKPYVAQSTPPEDHDVLWIDTSEVEVTDVNGVMF